MTGKLMGAAFFALLSGTAPGALAPLYEDDGLCGLPPSMVKESRWRTSLMTYPNPVEDKDSVWTGPDFFTAEFGRPCVFTEDWIKEFGYAEGDYKVADGFLEFKSGPKGFAFGFGPRAGDRSVPSLRIGSAWGRQMKDNLRIKMVVEQDVDATEWALTIPEQWPAFGATPFKVCGKGLQTVEANVGFVRCLRYADGFKLTCKTPGAGVKIKSVWLAPTSAEMFFRRVFELPEAPAMARCSFLVAPNSTAPAHELFVNGVKVDSGNFIYPGGQIRNVDLTAFLKKGVNVVAYGAQFRAWGDIGKPEFVFEGFAEDKDGKLTRLLGDARWKCSLTRQDGWEKLGFDDSKWLAPTLSPPDVCTALANGKKISVGLNPQHMGLLQCGPSDGRKNPLFDLSEGLKLKASIPSALKDSASISLDLCEGGCDKVVEHVQGGALTGEGGVVTALFEPRTREAGPYRLIWRLTDKKGEELDKRVDEAVLVGPVKQDFLKLDGFDQEFEKRLKLVTKIDCAKPVETGDEFVDHTGMGLPAMNVGRVVDKNGMTYRETGLGNCDYFAYRLHLKDRGEPHVAEIVIPDDAMRYVYSGVMESYPVNMCFNPSTSPGTWINATGCCYVGLRTAPSGGKRVLRYVFYPASRNSAVFVMSHFTELPAAALEINIYKVEGGLPALEIPRTARMFGAHHERMSTMQLTTGMCEQPLMFDKTVRFSPRDDAWFQFYKMFERKIQLLRFRGENMSAEGAFMYWEGEYPSAKHGPWTSTDEVDPLALLIKMYNQNGIKCLLGFEYFESQDVMAGNLGCPASDRRMQQDGAMSTRLVDRHGRQLVGYLRTGYNFLNPQIGSRMLDCLGELYDRYSKAGRVDGLFLVHSAWWLPSYNSGAYPELGDLEVGYDDITVALFEKETGVKLGIDPKDPNRFEMRYQAITSEHLPLWKLWRAKKMRAFIDEIGARVSKDPASKWKVFSLAGADLGTDQRSEEWNLTPFRRSGATRDERDSYIARRQAEAGFPADVFKETDGFVKCAGVLGLGNYGSELGDSFDHVYGLNNSASAVQARERSSALYFSIASGLDERACSSGALKRWIGRQAGTGVFIARGAEDDAFYELAAGLKLKRVPRVVFDNWHDCNLETAFDSQMRRFAESFYATPDAEFEPLPDSDCKGVFAQLAKLEDGSAVLRLTNDTPWTSEGSFSADVAKKPVDLVYGRELAAGVFSGGKFNVVMKPNDIRLFKLDGLKGPLRCEFSFPEKASQELENEARFILSSSKKDLRAVPGDLVSELFDKLKSGDDYALFQTLESFEVKANVKEAKAARAALERQKLLLSDLSEKGVARINFGAKDVYVDPQGRRWLPDQASVKGCEAYGHAGGNTVERGTLEVKGTDAPRVYQTELYGGRILVRVPVPNGKYKIRLLFAETFSGIQAPDRRNISVTVQGKTLPSLVDPFKDAGWGTAFVKEIDGVDVCDQAVEIVLTGNVEINGMEIEKAGK